MDPAEVWHERVEDALTVELGVLARRGLEPDASGFLGPGRVPVPTGLGAIAALSGAGLLRDEDAARWRARFADADGPFPDREPDHELRQRLHVYLGSLVEQVHADVGEADRRLAAVLRALRRFGLLDRDDVHWWLGLLPRREMPFERVGPPSLGKLRRSVPGPARRRRGLRVLAIDLFEGGVCVRLHLARNGRDGDGSLHPLPDDTSDPGRLASWEHALMVRDDVGTRYIPRGQGASGSRHDLVDGPRSLHIERVFSPAVPAGVRMLVLYADGARLFVRL